MTPRRARSWSRIRYAFVVVRALTRSWVPSIAVPALVAIAAGVAMTVTPTEILRMGEGSDNPVLMLLYRGQTVEQLMTLTGRIELWKGVIPLIEDRYLVGYGYLGSRALLLSVMPWAVISQTRGAATSKVKE